MLSCAYWVDKPFQTSAKTWPEWDRIQHAGPWAFYGYQGGTAAVLTDEACGKAHDLEQSLGAPADCWDGLRFYPPQDPQLVSLRQRECAASIPVELQCGVTVEIPIAQAAPRKVLFAGSSGKGAAGDYESLSYRLYDLLVDIHAMARQQNDGKQIDQAAYEAAAEEYERDSVRFAWLAFKTGYRATEELLDAIGWVTTDDLLPILMASWGIDPKKAAQPGSDDGT